MGGRNLRRSIVLSIAIHLLLALIFLYFSARYPSAPESPKLTYIQLEPAPEQKKNSKEDEDEFSKRVVQTEKGHEVDKAPPKAFLGEKNQEVDHQTVNRDQMTAMAHEGKPAPQTNLEKKHAARNESPQKDNGSKSAEKTPEKPPLLSEFGLKVIPDPKSGLGPKESDRSWVDTSDLTGSQAKDYVQGLETGEKTALNTREYVFYGYFQRIRSRLDHAWYPVLREKLTHYYEKGRKLASDMDHTTRLIVILNRNGEITRVEVVKESGTAELDDAAVRAFNMAGPFPNPPTGIIDSSGEIHIPWEFILKT